MNLIDTNNSKQEINHVHNIVLEEKH